MKCVCVSNLPMLSLLTFCVSAVACSGGRNQASQASGGDSATYAGGTSSTDSGSGGVNYASGGEGTGGNDGNGGASAVSSGGATPATTGGGASTGFSGGAATGGSVGTGSSKNTGGKNTGGGKAVGGSKASGGTASVGGSKASGGTAPNGGATVTGGASATGGAASITGGNTSTSPSGFPAGWLYTQGSKIYVADGNGGGQPWMGRGVNTDDIFFCGYNWLFWMTAPEDTLTTMLSNMLSGWKPNFIRVSLAMNSFQPSVSWTSNAAQYKTPMTSVINALGAHPNVYVLVTLRSHSTMTTEDEPTGIPTADTDPTYVALVDSFANSKFVLFGLSNEPGGVTASINTIASAMNHAVGVIRAEEDRLGVPHHIVAVQGSGYTADVSYYSTKPLAYDNVVYEVHGYPPATSSYTFSNIPVILGEYGALTTSTATNFYKDIEAKQISNLAWDFDSFNDCSPDLVEVTGSETDLVPTDWGKIVQAYLLDHAN